MFDITMCSPTFFGVTRRSPTNRMMNPGNPPDKGLAMRQWLPLYKSYRQDGLRVGVMEARPGLEDMTFVANAGLPVRGHFILSNFLENERRREKSYHGNHFGTVYGFDKIISLSCWR